MDTNRNTRACARLFGSLFGGYGKTETVGTDMHLQAQPEAVWRTLLTYEEVPGEPSLLLRTLLPAPMRTDGDKSRVGATIHCFYRGGNLIKQVTAADPPRYFEFEVTRQSLGIENCVRALCGSYSIRPSDSGSDIKLTTTYRAHLRPRFLWRPFERLMIHQLHRHILRGMEAALYVHTRETEHLCA